MEDKKFVFCLNFPDAKKICDLIGEGWEPKSLSQPLHAYRVHSALVFDLRILRYEKGLSRAEQWIDELRARMAIGHTDNIFVQ